MTSSFEIYKIEIENETVVSGQYLRLGLKKSIVETASETEETLVSRKNQVETLVCLWWP